MTGEPLAHSPKPPIPAQTYRRHIGKVHENALTNARLAVAHYRGNSAAFVDAADAASLYHDLGKLDDANQHILARISNNPLSIVHEDAGTQALLDLGRSESAISVAAHHRGLSSYRSEDSNDKPENRMFRHAFGDCDDAPCGGETVTKQIDDNLQAYLHRHRAAGCPAATPANESVTPFDGLTRRLLLSCLVDADFLDTERFMDRKRAGHRPVDPAACATLLERLDGHLAGKQLEDPARPVNRRRAEALALCREKAREAPGFFSLNVPTGGGKTEAYLGLAAVVIALRRLSGSGVFGARQALRIVHRRVSVLRRRKQRQYAVAIQHRRAAGALAGGAGRNHGASAHPHQGRVSSGGRVVSLRQQTGSGRSHNEPGGRPVAGDQPRHRAGDGESLLQGGH